MSLTFLSKSSPYTKPHPSLKGRRKGASLPCSSKWGPYRNIQNEFPFLGMGDFLGEGYNSKFFFDCHNTIIYIAIYIYLVLVVSFTEFNRI